MLLIDFRWVSKSTKARLTNDVHHTPTTIAKRMRIYRSAQSENYFSLNRLLDTLGNYHHKVFEHDQ
jgi:hypothetical protein